MSPTTPMTGVGYTARPSVSLYRLTLPPVMGISNARQMLAWQQRNSPLRRSVTLDQIGGAALYLLSELGSGVTGEVHHVDSGYHIVSMPVLDELKHFDGGSE